MKKISACWIAKNEEENIKRSIKSVRGLVDEMIVVDTGSEDGTAAAAEALGAKVFPFEWIHDFAAARNYALDQATGDIIIFLDADEWFEPALGKKDGSTIVKWLTENNAEALFVPMHNMNMQTGLVFDRSEILRIFYRRPDIRYYRKIHEALFKPGMKPLLASTITELTLLHSGYSPEVMTGKSDRNIEMLESIGDDDEQRYVNLFYLMREYHNRGNTDEAFQYMMKLAQNPSDIQKLVRRFPAYSSHFFYVALSICRDNRGKVSRRFVRESIIQPMKKMVQNHPGVFSIDLYYQTLFDKKEDKLLEGIELLERRQLPNVKEGGYTGSISAIYAAGARAAVRRGMWEKAFDYSSKGLIETHIFLGDVMRVMLNCLRGQEEVEIIAFLNSVMDISNPYRLRLLVSSLKFEGYQSLYVYYLKKQIDMGQATKGAFLYMMMLLGKYEKAVEAVLAEDFKADDDLVQEALFLAAVCSGKEEIYREHHERMGDYTNILDSFFSGIPLESVTLDEIRLLQNHYHDVAFAIGVERADRLLHVFERQRQVTFFHKAKYCVDSGLYDLILREPSFGLEDDFTTQLLLIQANCGVGRYDEALAMIERLLPIMNFEARLYDALLVVAEKAAPKTAATARVLYNAYQSLWDEYTDLNDVIVTGFAYDDSSKQQKKALSAMTAERLQKELDELPKTDHPLLKDVRLQAAKIYAEQKMPVMAEGCYKRLLACGYNDQEIRDGLAELYEAAGNPDMAASLKDKQEVPC